MSCSIGKPQCLHSIFLSSVLGATSSLYLSQSHVEVLPEGTMLDLEAAEPQDVAKSTSDPIRDLWNAINALRVEVRIIKVEIDTSQGTIKGGSS